MWAVARYDLGLTSEEFFRLTPRQYDALLKRREYETQQAEFLFAQLTSYFINFSMCHPKDPTKPRDFMPSMWGNPEPPAKRVKLTKKKQKEVTEAFRSGLAALRAAAARRGKLRTKTRG